MRLTKEKLKEITGREQPAAQARWFFNHFGIRIAHDEEGPIVTDNAFEALIMRKMGLSAANEKEARPQVKKPAKNAA